jgi:HD-GYP domain-containing protein (c-di-GMP phosphodiesterase class II)
MSTEEAVEELRSNRGTQFDPVVVDALIDTLGERRRSEERDRT